MSKTHKYLALLFTLIFILFAAVQYNDPDPWLWIPIYGIAALISLGAYFGRLNKNSYIAAGLAYLAGAVLYWPAEFHGIVFDEAFRQQIENARESLGLFICFLVMVYYYFVSRKI